MASRRPPAISDPSERTSPWFGQCGKVRVSFEHLNPCTNDPSLFRIPFPASQTAKSSFNIHVTHCAFWLAYPWFYTFSARGHAVCSCTTRRG
jgi:hypothetical protein